MFCPRTIYQTSRSFSTMTTACVTKPYVGLSDLVSRQRSLRVVLDLDKPSSNVLSRKELYQLYNLSYLQVPENEEELVKMQKSITEFTAWLSSLSTINTEGYEAVYSPIDHLSKSVGYVISSLDVRILYVSLIFSTYSRMVFGKTRSSFSVLFFFSWTHRIHFMKIRLPYRPKTLH